jgi:hypothetical protein
MTATRISGRNCINACHLGNKKGQASCLTSLGFVLSTVPVHPWSRESRYQFRQPEDCRPTSCPTCCRAPARS